jgi:hypothetical protein
MFSPISGVTPIGWAEEDFCLKPRLAEKNFECAQYVVEVIRQSALQPPYRIRPRNAMDLMERERAGGKSILPNTLESTRTEVTRLWPNIIVEDCRT